MQTNERRLRQQLRHLAFLVIETGFDLLTEYGKVFAGLVTNRTLLEMVLHDYDWALRRLNVTNDAQRLELVNRLGSDLEGGKLVDLAFRLSPNTWACLLHAYADYLVERWGKPGEPPDYQNGEDDGGPEVDEVV